MYNLPGSAAAFPVNVRAPSGDENRTTPVLARAFQDCADRTAYLYSRTVARQVATTSALQALTGLDAGTVVNVAGIGNFVLDGSHTYGEVALFIYNATGMGSGWYWIHESRLYLFGNSDNFVGDAMKIDPALIPPQYYVSGPITLPTARIQAQVTATSLTTVATVHLGPFLAGDRIVGTIGPIDIYSDASTGDASFVLSAQDSYDSSPPASVAEVALLLPSTSGTRVQRGPSGPMTIPFIHTVAQSGTVELLFRAAASSSFAVWVTTYDTVFLSVGQYIVYRGVV